jgi:hypothetical protein
MIDLIHWLVASFFSTEFSINIPSKLMYWLDRGYVWIIWDIGCSERWKWGRRGVNVRNQKEAFMLYLEAEGVYKIVL